MFIYIYIYIIAWCVHVSAPLVCRGREEMSVSQKPISIICLGHVVTSRYPSTFPPARRNTAAWFACLASCVVWYLWDRIMPRHISSIHIALTGEYLCECCVWPSISIIRTNIKEENKISSIFITMIIITIIIIITIMILIIIIITIEAVAAWRSGVRPYRTCWAW